MIKRIIAGGITTLVIGGSSYAINQSDVNKNFSNNTGMTQQQAQNYVNNISPSDLESFSKAGQDMTTDGNSILTDISGIDCENYTYKWGSTSLSCTDGKTQLQTIGNDEITLGNCYQALDTNLGDSAKTKMSECITDIDAVNSDYSLSVATALIDSNTLSSTQTTNTYNKSVLQTALQTN